MGNNTGTERAFMAIPTVLAKTPIDAAVNLLTGKNPIAGIQSNVRTAVGDLALWPFRFTKHVLVGGTKTALKLGWAALINSPIIPVGNRGKALLRNPAQALNSFSASLSSGSSPTAAFNAIAPKPPVNPSQSGSAAGAPPNTLGA